VWLQPQAAQVLLVHIKVASNPNYFFLGPWNLTPIISHFRGSLLYNKHVYIIIIIITLNYQLKNLASSSSSSSVIALIFPSMIDEYVKKFRVEDR
jgi:hypothetical protein